MFLRYKKHRMTIALCLLPKICPFPEIFLDPGKKPLSTCFSRTFYTNFTYNFFLHFIKQMVIFNVKKWDKKKFFFLRQSNFFSKKVSQMKQNKWPITDIKHHFFRRKVREKQNTRPIKCQYYRKRFNRWKSLYFFKLVKQAVRKLLHKHLRKLSKYKIDTDSQTTNVNFTLKWILYEGWFNLFYPSTVIKGKKCFPTISKKTIFFFIHQLQSTKRLWTTGTKRN